MAPIKRPNQTEAWFRAIYQHAATGIAITDLQGRFVQCNPAYSSIVGYEEKALQQMNFSSLVHPADRDANLDVIRQLVAREIPSFTIENRYVHQDGHPVWVRKYVSLLPDAEGAPGYILGLVTDVTDRRRNDDALRAALDVAALEQRRLAAVLDAIPAGVSIADADGNVVQINRALAALWAAPETAFTLEAYRARKGWWRRTGQSLAFADWPMNRALRDGLVIPSEIIDIETFDGRRATIVGTAAPIRSETGAIIGGVAAQMDITAQKIAEDALRQAQEKLTQHAASLEAAVAARTQQLQEVVAELGTFSYSVSHDLRAPLRTITGFADILKTDCGDQLSPEGQKHLERILRAGARMDALITDVLEYSRVSRTDLVIEEVDLAAIVRDVVETLGLSKPPGGQIEIMAPLPRVLASAAALQQSLSNLISNALKFSRPGVPPHVRVRGEVLPGFARIWVEDNGIGIRPEHKDKVWGIFERLSTTYEGTGVGLSIVRRAVDRMGGRVGFESTPGQGSQFWIELPRG